MSSITTPSTIAHEPIAIAHPAAGQRDRDDLGVVRGILFSGLVGASFWALLIACFVA